MNWINLYWNTFEETVQSLHSVMNNGGEKMIIRKQFTWKLRKTSSENKPAKMQWRKSLWRDTTRVIFECTLLPTIYFVCHLAKRQPIKGQLRCSFRDLFLQCSIYKSPSPNVMLPCNVCLGAPQRFHTSQVLLITYLWPENLLMWSMYIKWNPCLCSQALSGSIRNVQTMAGTFSTVCYSSTHIFHLLRKLKFQRLGAGSLSFCSLFR